MRAAVLVVVSSVLALRLHLDAVAVRGAAEQPLSCEQANRFAFQSMKSLGYEVTSFEPAAIGRAGVLRGGKTDPDSGRSTGHDGVVHITCDSSEVRLAAAQRAAAESGSHVHPRILSRVHRNRRPCDHQRRLRRRAVGWDGRGRREVQDPASARARDQARLRRGPRRGRRARGEGHGAERQPGDLHARSGGDRAPAPRRQRQGAAARPRAGVTGGREGGCRRPRSGHSGSDPGEHRGDAPQRALAAGTLKPGAHAEGFVYFPTGSYARARATLVDVESGESEGFLVEF